MKKNIAIVTGGDSSELVISLKSAGQVSQHLDSSRYASWIVYIRGEDWHVRLDPEGLETLPVNRDNFSFVLEGSPLRFDYAFIAMHGPPGENGELQEYFDRLGIPYSTSGASSLKRSFNKYLCKESVRKAGILTAEARLIRKGKAGIHTTEARPIREEEETDWDPRQLINLLGLPCFIKPNEGGSSFGVSRIDRIEELEEAVRKALEEDDEVLVESLIPGNELTCGVLKTASREFLFPVTEIISKNEFFDYEAKYTEGMADEITPAQIPDSLAEKCQAVSSQIYDLLDCRGLVRIDFINREGDLYFLELNGVPGMTRESIIPKMIRTLGHTEAEIYNLIIEDTAGW